MGVFAIEHSPVAYWADAALYGVVIVGLSAFLIFTGQPGQWLGAIALVCAGWVGWTLVEYGLHRFVLHGLQPFRGWHESHHQRPRALIHTPTLLSANLMVLLVYLPAWALGGPWPASALTLGVLIGYQAYATTHHAVHHWRATGPWLRQCKRRHALHHRADPAGTYGVSTAFWDHLFRRASQAYQALQRSLQRGR